MSTVIGKKKYLLITTLINFGQGYPRKKADTKNIRKKNEAIIQIL